MKLQGVVAPVDWPLAELPVVLVVDNNPLLDTGQAVEQGRAGAAAVWL